MIAASYQFPNSGIDVGRLVTRTLLKMDWSLKHAALEMELDEATFSRGLHGLGPLDVHRLALLPSAFWWKFLRAVLRCGDRARRNAPRKA